MPPRPADPRTQLVTTPAHVLTFQRQPDADHSTAELRIWNRRADTAVWLLKKEVFSGGRLLLKPALQMLLTPGSSSSCELRLTPAASDSTLPRSGRDVGSLEVWSVPVPRGTTRFSRRQFGTAPWDVHHTSLKLRMMNGNRVLCLMIGMSCHIR